MKTIALALAGLLLLAVVGVFVFRAAAQRRVAARLRINSSNGVDVLEKVRLGGVEQWIQIRGHDRAQPILLFLHGGPGFPEMPFAHRNAELAENFVVVEWDQRGAGKSYAFDLRESSMSAEQIVADAHDLVLLLRQRFGVAKIVLVGHSWGTILGARLVAKYSELFHAYIAISQVVNPPESERLMYRFALERARRNNVEEAVADLTRIGLPPYKNVDDFQTMNRWIHHFGDLEYKELRLMQFVRLGFASPVYSLADFARLGLGYRLSMKHLWRDAFWINFFQEIPRLEVPVYFFLGRHDRTSTASSVQAALYFEALDAPQGKELIWFEKSGHWPHLNESAKYRKLMVETVLKQVRQPEKISYD